MKSKKNYTIPWIIHLIVLTSILRIAYPDNKESIIEPKDKTQSWLQAIKTKNNESWQEFKNKKEIMDINYDLYRMWIKGPETTEQVTLAQDPKGYLVYKHDTAFCSPDLDPKCNLKSPIYTYGDLKVSGLFHNNIYKEKDKIDLANEIIRNIINPFPSNIALEMLDAPEKERKDPKNQAALAETYASQARLSIARNTFNQIFFNRLPLDSLHNSAPPTKEKFSVTSIMEHQANHRFENPEWHKLIDTADLNTQIKEIAKMEAFKLWLDYQKYKQNERIESLLATLVAQQESLHKALTKKKYQ